MDDFLSYRRLDRDRCLYISSLSRATIQESDAAHMGDTGYFLYEASKDGIEVLAKVASVEAAMRLMDAYEAAISRAMRIGTAYGGRLKRRVSA
jgi:hypothetical protein